MARPLRPDRLTGTSISTPSVRCVHCAAGVLPISDTFSRSDHFRAWVTGLKPGLVTYTQM